MITTEMIEAARAVEKYSEGRRQVWAGIYADLLGLNTEERNAFFRMCDVSRVEMAS